MSNDRELLELAAKAAGMDGPLEWVENQEIWEGLGCEYFTGFLVGKHYYQWNPLTDDGDALRLAVKLKLTLAYNDYYAFCDLKDDPSDPEISYGYSESIEKDPFAATRRAIVRAAAEIGRTMA